MFDLKDFAKLYKKIGTFFRKYINGTKGAVSLLLVLVMSPLLSVSLILVESARYQNAVQLMEEIIDSAAFSTLAEYDTFIDERFGLLSVSQKTNISDTFRSYMDENVSSIGKSVTIDSHSAAGQFPLSNTDVLKQQVLEYSEISVASEMIIEGFDIDKLLDQLNSSLDLDDIKDEIEAVNATMDVASEVEKLIEAIVKIKDQYNDKYVVALSEYKSAYTTFKEKAVALIEALKTAEDNLEEGESHDNIYNEDAVKNAVNELKKARDTYKDKATTLKTEYSTLKGHIDTVFSSMSSLTEKLKKFEDKTSDGSVVDKCTTSSYEWLLIILGTITRTIETSIGDDYSNKMNAELNALQEQITKLGNLEDKTITSAWTESKVSTEYGPLSLTSVRTGLGEILDQLIKKLDKDSAATDDEKLKMTDLLDLAGDLLGVSGLYDINLNAVVDAAKLYEDTSMSLSSKLVMSSITDLLDACDEFTKGITSFNVIKAVKALAKLLKAIAEFLTAIISWVAESLVNLVSYVASGPKEWYNSLLLYGYAAYNLPNRTNYDSGKTLAGYSYNNIFTMAGGIKRGDAITGSISELSTLTNSSGSDKMFKGAEAEYILVGSTNELMNQSVAFFDLYLFRLVCDLIPVLKNGEVSAMAALAGPGSWVVKLAIALAEPMLDTIILVNSSKSSQYIYKKTLYLTGSGITLLLQDLTSIAGVSQNLKDKIKDSIIAKNGDASVIDKGIIDATYTEHLLLLLLLSVNQQTYMQRLQNIIQLEAAVKNESDFKFELSRAYTFINTDVAYTLNPMFNLDSLTGNGLFTATSKRYSGY